MTRAAAVMICLLGLAVATFAIDDDNCRQEAMNILERYSVGSLCRRTLNDAITVTEKDNCPNEALMVDCFSLAEDDWTDFYDDCEDAFDGSACLRSYGDDEFERLIKDDCAKGRRQALDMSSTNSTCDIVLSNAIYGTAEDCPQMDETAVCFNDNEDEWTDLVDDCENLFESSSCQFLKDMSDDEFEEFVKNDASTTAGTALVAAFAAGTALLLAL